MNSACVSRCTAGTSPSLPIAHGLARWEAGRRDSLTTPHHLSLPFDASALRAGPCDGRVAIESGPGTNVQIAAGRTDDTRPRPLGASGRPRQPDCTSSWTSRRGADLDRLPGLTRLPDPEMTMRFEVAFGTSRSPRRRDEGTPCRMLILSDLRGNAAEAPEHSVGRPIVRVDAENIEQVLSRYAPSVTSARRQALSGFSSARSTTSIQMRLWAGCRCFSGCATCVRACRARSRLPARLPTSRPT